VTKSEGGADMGVGMSVVLLALGAALVWGTTGHARGVALTVTGVVLVVVGTAGTVLSLAYRWRRGSQTRQAGDERHIVDC
jgi:hypothetical protein